MMRFFRAIGKRLHVLGFLLLLITFVLGVYLAVGNILLAANFPHKRTWQPWTVWFVALLVSAVWVPVYALGQAIRARRRARAQLKTQARRDLALLCQRAVAAIAHGCADVSVNQLAACVWLCRDDGGFNEIARFYLPDDRPALGVRWSKGKGVAGWAWELRKDLFVDLRKLVEKLEQIGTSAFNELPANERFALSADELERTKQYTGVAAIQLFSTDGNAKLLGMLILDFGGADGFDCIVGEAQRWPVRSYTGACAKVLTEADGKL